MSRAVWVYLTFPTPPGFSVSKPRETGMRRLSDFDSWVVAELQKHADGLSSDELYEHSITTHSIVRRALMGLDGDGYVSYDHKTERYRPTESGLAALAEGPREPVSWREFMDGETHSLSAQQLDIHGMTTPEFEIRLHINAVTRGLKVARITPAPEGMVTSFYVRAPSGESLAARKVPRSRNLPRALFREAVEKWADGQLYSVGVEEVRDRFQLTPEQFRRKLYAYAFDNGMVAKLRNTEGVVTFCMGTVAQVKDARVPKRVNTRYTLDPRLMNQVADYITWRAALAEVVPSESPAISMDVVRELIDSKRTANRYLTALENEGRITGEREGKFHYWQPA